MVSAASCGRLQQATSDSVLKEVFCKIFRSVEHPELSKFPLSEPGVGQKIALYTTPTARNFALFISAFSVHLFRVFVCVCMRV